MTQGGTQYAGYVPRRRTREIVGDEVELVAEDEGAEPFRATIVTNLTFDEIDALDVGERSFQELWAVMAPYVLAWNALGRNAETGAWEPLPPPAEGGPQVFRAVAPAVTFWLLRQLRQVHLGGPERPKESPPSAATPAPPNVTELASGSSPKRSSRRTATGG